MDRHNEDGISCNCLSCAKMTTADKEYMKGKVRRLPASATCHVLPAPVTPFYQTHTTTDTTPRDITPPQQQIMKLAAEDLTNALGSFMDRQGK